MRQTSPSGCVCDDDLVVGDHCLDEEKRVPHWLARSDLDDTPLGWLRGLGR